MKMAVKAFCKIKKKKKKLLSKHEACYLHVY